MVYNTLDQITAKRVEAMLCIVCGDRDCALELYKEIASLFDELLKKKREIQYESQKSVDIARLEISKMVQKIRMNEEKAERDALTGLMNRSALVTVSGEFIENAKKIIKNSEVFSSISTISKSITTPMAMQRGMKPSS